MSSPTGNCDRCAKRLVPVGTSRKNGVQHHDDWNTRRLHKKCWLEQLEELAELFAQIRFALLVRDKQMKQADVASALEQWRADRIDAKREAVQAKIDDAYCSDEDYAWEEDHTYGTPRLKGWTLSRYP